MPLPLHQRLVCRYYAGLTLMESRFPISKDRSHIHIAFKWYDAFRPTRALEQSSIHFEKAAILFNLGAVLTQQALGCDLKSDAGIKDAARKFQASHILAPDNIIAFLPALAALMCGSTCQSNKTGQSEGKELLWKLTECGQLYAWIGDIASGACHMYKCSDPERHTKFRASQKIDQCKKAYSDQIALLDCLQPSGLIAGGRGCFCKFEGWAQLESWAASPQRHFPWMRSHAGKTQLGPSTGMHLWESENRQEEPCCSCKV